MSLVNLIAIAVDMPDMCCTALYVTDSVSSKRSAPMSCEASCQLVDSASDSVEIPVACKLMSRSDLVAHLYLADSEVLTM